MPRARGIDTRRLWRADTVALTGSLMKAGWFGKPLATNRRATVFASGWPMSTAPAAYERIRRAVVGRVLNVEDGRLDAEEGARYWHPLVGEEAFCSRVITADPEQLLELVRQIPERHKRNHLVVAKWNQEGGRVQRSVKGFCRLPAAQSFALHGGWKRTTGAGGRVADSKAK